MGVKRSDTLRGPGRRRCLRRFIRGTRQVYRRPGGLFKDKRPAPTGPGKVTPSATMMLRIRRIAAQAQAIPGFSKPSARAAFSAVRCTAWRCGACLAGYSAGGMLLPDESGRLARCHLDGQTGLPYPDAADTADHVAGVEEEPDLPGRIRGPHLARKRAGPVRSGGSRLGCGNDTRR